MNSILLQKLYVIALLYSSNCIDFSGYKVLRIIIWLYFLFYGIALQDSLRIITFKIVISIPNLFQTYLTK